MSEESGSYVSLAKLIALLLVEEAERTSDEAEEKSEADGV